MASRVHGFPSGVVEPIWLAPDDAALKAHSAYSGAKAGDVAAAVALLSDLAFPFLTHVRRRLPAGACFDAAVVVLVNAGRLKYLHPDPPLVRQIQSRHGHEIEQILGIHPAALTANEATYLIGFRSTDEIRNRLAKARQETDLRLRSKGIAR